MNLYFNLGPSEGLNLGQIWLSLPATWTKTQEKTKIFSGSVLSGNCAKIVFTTPKRPVYIQLPIYFLNIISCSKCQSLNLSSETKIYFF